MAKIYSSLFLLALAFFPSLVFAQNVGVGVANPLEKLDVDGAIRIKSTTGNLAGTIRYNPTTKKFEGRDDVSWKEFGSGSGIDDWTEVGSSPNPSDAIAIYHSGNVGIGTTIPLVKLHVKGLGATAIKAETSNSNDTIPAIYAVNTIGIAVKATTSSATKSAIVAINTDSSGYALKVINNQAIGQIGGNAAFFIGDINIEGGVRNDNLTLYGGSVAVNDGMTVGDIAGASCTPVNSVVDSFEVNLGASFGVILQGKNNNPIYSNIKTFSPTKDCRAITNVYIEPYVGDEQVFPLNFDIWVRDNFIATVYEPSANLNQNPPLPGYYPSGPLVLFTYNNSLCGCYTSKWGFDTHIFDGEDPNAVANNNWFVQFSANSSDGEYLFGYKGRVNYKWGDTIAAPAYAAFGDIRASGSIYANSDNLLGDVAEYFKIQAMAREPEVGDIVSISKKDPQTFEISSSPYDPLVVGVISENPSVHLNDPSSGYPIGLTGRVKVKVNLLGGKIEVGDPITTSSIAGVGMKAKEAGTIVGYALEAFDGSRTDEGKIIILLARGHVEKISSSIKVEQVENLVYGGMLIKGAIKVLNDEKIIFVPWDDKLIGKIPADVEFDDLFVELTPFGGNAKMIVKAVNAEGITVEIIQKEEGFKGFYYQTDIVTSRMPSTSGAEDASVQDTRSYDERIQQAIKLNKEWAIVFDELQRKGGLSLEPIQKMTSGKQVNLYKKEVIKSWQRNAPELFAKWQDLGKDLSQVIGHDQSIIRKIKEAN